MALTMDNYEKLNETILIIDRYSDYLHRKAWGKVLIIWGILLPFTLTLYVYSIQLAIIFNLEADFIQLLATSLFLVLGLGLTLYIFISLPSLTFSKQKEVGDSSVTSRYHGLIIGFTWFLLFILPKYIPEPFTMVAYLVAGSFGLIISYFVLQKSHGSYKELLVTGIILFVSSVPLVALSVIDLPLAHIAIAISFAISFMSGGLYSLRMARKILDGKV